jgi:hypothetical protein
MKIWGLTEQEIRDSAAEVGLTIHSDWSGHGIYADGRALRCRLALGGGERNANGFLPYQRRGFSKRRIPSVCWHGHRDFMRACFRRNSEARIKTAFADYRGTEDFEFEFEATGDRNIGSLFEPMSMRDACDCNEDDRAVRFGTLMPSGEVMHVRTISQSKIMACPHVIIAAEHYREDGSCKCDDPEEQRRMIREWGYSESDFDPAPTAA